MGLDFNRGDAYWSYTGFNKFRAIIFEQETGANIKEWWQGGSDETVMNKEHPLYELMNHSDCDGEISLEKLGPMVSVLTKAIKAMPDEYADYREVGMLMVVGILECIQEGVPLKFQ